MLKNKGFSNFAAPLKILKRGQGGKMKKELIKKLEELLRDRPISEIIEEVHQLEDEIRAGLQEAHHKHEDAADAEAHAPEPAALPVEEKEKKNSEVSADAAPEADPGSATLKTPVAAMEAEEAPGDEIEAAVPEEKQEEAGKEDHEIRTEVLSPEELQALENRFKELMNIFSERLEKYKEHVREEEEKNYEEKKKVIAGLREIITEEQNIGQAINKFRNLQRKWKNIGNVPSSKYRELQSEYSFEVERFNYTLSIIKGLKELDLQKNLERKQKLVELMQALTEEKSVKRMEMMVKSYQEEWEEAGPVPQENWEEVRDAFRDATHAVYDKINAHYEQLRKKQEENLEKKKALLAKAKEISELELKSPKKWTRHTEDIQKLQQEWRQIGRAPKAENDQVWEAFREACNQFFDRKKEYFKALREERSKNRERKEEIIRKAKEWEGSEDWREATEAIIKLQKEWKETGPADQRDEQRLWTEFRGICDQFFERKKNYFATIDERHKENMEAKEALIAEIESFEPGEDKKANLEQLSEYAKRWKSIGHVPRKKIDELNTRYHKALDAAYDKLGVKAEEKKVLRYKNKVEGMIRSRHKAGNDLRSEQRALKDRLRRTRELIDQYETNINFFKVASGSSPLLDEAKKKIERARQEAIVMEEKLKVLNRAMQSK